MVKRDKELKYLSHYVKDVFGLKIVVGSEHDADLLHQVLHALTWC